MKCLNNLCYHYNEKEDNNCKVFDNKAAQFCRFYTNIERTSLNKKEVVNEKNNIGICDNGDSTSRQSLH